MIFHKKFRSINWIGLSLLLLGIIAGVWWFRTPKFVTGATVPVDTHPYYQLAYVKFDPNHGGNFVGDTYLLDVTTGETTQLTHGGETNPVSWLDREHLVITERPRGSVVNTYYLNVNTGRVIADDLGVSTNYLPERYDSFDRSSDGELVVISIFDNENNILTNSYRTQVIDVDTEETIIRISALTRPARWLPNRHVLLVERNNNDICVYDIDAINGDCIDGIRPTLSPSVSPLMIAYVKNTDNMLYELCVSTIGDEVFGEEICYDQHSEPFHNLIWRP